ncbi:MAG: hypothetical protein MK160_03065 [Rhodobacteraceae bacterium]|nr:hypothetical protein [Paracoccaceae bacterium]
MAAFSFEFLVFEILRVDVVALIIEKVSQFFKKDRRRAAVAVLAFFPITLLLFEARSYGSHLYEKNAVSILVSALVDLSVILIVVVTFIAVRSILRRR